MGSSMWDTGFLRYTCSTWDTGFLNTRNKNSQFLIKYLSQCYLKIITILNKADISVIKKWESKQKMDSGLCPYSSLLSLSGGQKGALITKNKLFPSPVLLVSNVEKWKGRQRILWVPGKNSLHPQSPCLMITACGHKVWHLFCPRNLGT